MNKLLAFFWINVFCLAVGTSMAEIRFVQNRGQWKKGDYKVSLNGGELFFKDGNMIWTNRPSMHAMRELAGKGKKSYLSEYIFLNLLNANISPGTSGQNAFSTAYNYFLSDGQAKVQYTETEAYSMVEYRSIYPGINQVWYENGNGLEFDFQVNAGSDPTQIGLEVLACALSLRKGEIQANGMLGSIFLAKPIAYQLVNGKKNIIPCRYQLRGKQIHFKLGRYDTGLPLTIDPRLTFATLSGSSADNWGTAATYDHEGNAYGAGMVFDEGFPVTAGVVGHSFNGFTDELNGSNVDLGIQKFSSDGRRLLYATYLGGAGVDIPHSMVCDSLGNLIILGSTGSMNYPVTSGQFSHGAFARPFDFDYLTYPNGCDIFLTKLSPQGNQMLASRFIGGGGVDGMLDWQAKVLYNYGDQFRGEVNVDRYNNIYIASNSKSFGLATSGAFQELNRGGYDALVGKFSPDLSTNWITYLGGSADDAAYSIRCLNSGKVLVCGGTTSNNFPTTTGSFTSTRATPVNSLVENQIDGWLALFSPNGEQLKASTFISSRWYDQAYLVEENQGKSFYVYGQTRGDLQRMPGTFGSVTGGMFLYQFDSTLATLKNACRFGRRPNSPEISPTALTVDSCGQAYLAGWGSILGQTWPVTSLTTNGLQITSDASQSNTDGNDFYFMVLTSDFRTLKYGTFFGGRGADEHVDGGTSRFDRNGTIYQAVCADCGGSSVFPASPGAYSSRNQSFNCNLGLVKFDFSPLSVPLKLTVGPDSICPGQAITIVHNAGNNQDFSLHALPSDTSLRYGSPLQFFPSGDSTSILIRLTGTGPGCSSRDTLEKQIKILNKPDIKDTVIVFCPSDTLRLDYPPQYRYTWSPSFGLVSDTGSHQILTDGLEHTYTVTIQDRQTHCIATAHAKTRNRTGSINLLYKDESKFCALDHIAVIRLDSSFRPNFWLVNDVPYTNLDSIRIAFGEGTLYASVRSVQICNMFDSIAIKLPPHRPSFDTTFSEFIRGDDCSHLGRLLRANGRPDSVYWVVGNNEIPSQELSIGAEHQNLLLIQTIAGCPDTAYINLPDIGFIIPNVLTLNADGLNDKLEIKNIDFETFTIYNRWGKRVFEQKAGNSIKSGSAIQWDPSRELPSGTYFFNIRLRDSVGCKGWIELVK